MPLRPLTSSGHLGSDRIRGPLLLLGVAAGYLAMAQFVIWLNDPVNLGAGFWPAAGFSLGVLVLVEPRRWGWVLAGVGLAELGGDLVHGYPLDASLWWTAGNCVEPLVGALLLRRWGNPSGALVPLRQFGRFAAAAVVAGPLVGASIGTIGSVFALGPKGIWEVWPKYVVGDALGVLVVAPMLLCWSQRRIVRPAVETATLVLAVLVVTSAAFLTGAGALDLVPPYLVIPLLTWAALRHGCRGAAVAVFATTQIANWATATGSGPFAHAGAAAGQAVTLLQMFLVLTAVSAFVLAAVVEELVDRTELEAHLMEQRAAEQALRDSEERVRSVVNGSPLAIIEFDTDGVVRFWNPSAEAMYGWAVAEVEGRRPPFTTPDGSAAFDTLFQRVLAGEDVNNADLVRRRKDEHPVHVSVSMSPLRGPDGEVVGVTSVGLDVTHQRRLEEDLRQAQKMEAVGRLAGGIAHDFNNILTVVIGHGEILLSEVDPAGPVASRVTVMYDAARRAAELTDQLLAFSRRRVSAGEPADANAVVSSLQPMLDRLIGEHIDLHFQLCSDKLPVALDRLELERVALNLIQNAGDAMPRGGQLTVTTEKGTVAGATTALLRVSDTGTGMDGVTKGRVFEPFFTTKAAGEGTGLGLSTAYGIVRQHDGDIEVTSDREVGTVFTVTLPLTGTAGSRVAETGSDEPAFDERACGRAGTVLLVEDEATVRALAREVLLLAGHTVLEAADGGEALTVAQSYGGVIDVLVTDVVLPRLSGPELAERMQAAQPELAVVLMSGYPERHLTGIEQRNLHFLAKPFSPVNLAAVVADAMSSAGGPAPGNATASASV